MLETRKLGINDELLSVHMAVILSWIKKDLTEGNPLLGLARLNENIAPDSVLHSMLKDLVDIPTKNEYEESALKKLRSGEIFHKLLAEEQRAVLNYKKSVAINTHRLVPHRNPRATLKRNNLIYERRAFRASIRASNRS